MFNTDYMKKEVKVLDKIARILAELDEALAKLDDSTSHKERVQAERKAIGEINRFMKQSEKLDNIQGDKLAVDEYGTPEEYARQNQALREIEGTCDSLHETIREGDLMEELDEEGEQTLRDAMREIRQILRTTGRFDDYSEDERNRIINGLNA